MKKLPYLIPALLLATPFIFSTSLNVYALPVLILLTLLSYLVVSRQRIPIAKAFTNKAFLAYFVVLLVMLPFSMLVIRSVTPILWWLVYLVAFITLQGVVKSDSILKFMSGFFVAITALFGLVSIYSFIVIGLTSYTRLDGIVGPHNVYGGFLIIPFLLSLYFVFKESPIWQRSLWIASSAIIFSSIILTFSRGTWLSVLVVLVASFFLFRKKFNMAALKSSFASLAVLIVSTTLITSGIWLIAKHNTTVNNPAQTSTIAVFSNQDDENNAFTARLHYFGDALVTFTHSPIVGFGLGTYANDLRMYKTDPNYGSFDDPHNWLLKMLVEGGVFTAIILLVFIGSLFWQIWKLLARHHQAQWLSRAIFAGLLANALHGLMDFDWSYSVLLLVFFCFAGALYGVLQHDDELVVNRSIVQAEPTVKTLSKWTNYVLVLVLIAGSIFSIQLFRADMARADGDYLYYVKKDPNHAIDSYFASAAINGHEPTTWFNLSRSYYQMKNYGSAKYCLKKAIGLSPQSGLFYTAWAEIDEAQGDYSDYHETLLKAIKYFPADDLTDYVKLIRFDYKQKKYDEAAALIDSVLPVYTHYQSVLWFKSDPNSAAIGANLVSLNELKIKILAAQSISASTK